MIEAVEFDVLNLLVLLAVAWVFGSLSERLGYPALMGELLAGIVFGPPLLGLLHPAVELEILAELGVFLLMVYVGMIITALVPVTMKWGVDWLAGADELYRMEGREVVGVEGA